jgi:hypothetical protein
MGLRRSRNPIPPPLKINKGLVILSAAKNLNIFIEKQCFQINGSTTLLTFFRFIPSSSLLDMFEKFHKFLKHF